MSVRGQRKKKKKNGKTREETRTRERQEKKILNLAYLAERRISIFLSTKLYS